MELAKIKARELGIDPEGMNKFELIKAIQIREGYKPCYGRFSISTCKYPNCCWRNDCLGFYVKASIVFDVE